MLAEVACVALETYWPYVLLTSIAVLTAGTVS